MRQIILFLTLFFFHLICYADKPDFMLLETYKNQNVTGWVMSEKLDGVRGYWDGKQLFTRGGIINTIATKGFFSGISSVCH